MVAREKELSKRAKATKAEEHAVSMRLAALEREQHKLDGKREQVALEQVLGFPAIGACCREAFYALFFSVQLPKLPTPLCVSPSRRTTPTLSLITPLYHRHDF